ATSVDHQLVAAAGGAVHTCIDKERQALLDFKAQLQDPYDRLSTWRPDEEDNCCQWRGVECSNRTGHVTSLDLFGSYGRSGLEGEISLSLLKLSYLNYLSLSVNSFHGTIPEFIGNMTQLTHFDLSFNSFHGTIPEFIYSMTHLAFLRLDYNQFTGTIPESIGNMTQLTELHLSVNNFSGVIPRSIGSLTKLTMLWLFGNNMSGAIPRSIGSLTKLTWLDLFDNIFYGTIPKEFRNLTNLEYLSISNLTVENLDWLSSLSSLGSLSMDGIFLAKANNLVNVIIGLPNLSGVSLVGCDISQVMHPYSPSVNSSLSLYYLSLDNNKLNSSMFPTLKELYASSNQFTGSLSDEIQNFSSLERLNLSSNELDGTISDKLWQLPNLQELYLSSNSLRGAISENIGKSNLVYIDLSNKSLEGVLLNDDVSNHSWSIQYIDFSSNKLGPRFPEWIQKLENLTHLNLSRNNISDTVSTEYWNRWKSSQLSYLDLSFNNISGKLPKSLSNHDLKLIDLSFNFFYGPIPAQI
ncbi:leucine-rich repeat-containing protein, partial [Tanacetum coccineum]